MSQSTIPSLLASIPSPFPIFSCAYLLPDKLIAYGGGGGSAKSGIVNSVIISSIDSNVFQVDTDAPSASHGTTLMKIPTGNGICTCLEGIVISSSSNSPSSTTTVILLAIGVGTTISFFELKYTYDTEASSSSPSQSQVAGELNLTKVGEFTHAFNDEGINTMRFHRLPSPNNTQYLLATGGEDGRLIISHVTRPSHVASSEELANAGVADGGALPLIISCHSDVDAHSESGKAISSLAFFSPPSPPSSEASDSIVNIMTGGKDGVSHIYSISTYSKSTKGETTLLQTLSPSLPPPPPPPQSKFGSAKKQNLQVMIKGVGTGEEGVLYTVSSGRRGSAYLTKW